jgi:hypothetical protein
LIDWNELLDLRLHRAVTVPTKMDNMELLKAIKEMMDAKLKEIKEDIRAKIYIISTTKIKINFKHQTREFPNNLKI